MLKGRKPTLEEVFNTLSGGFAQGGPPTGKANRDGLKNNASTTRAVRIGVTEAYVEMARSLGPKWLERNLSLFVKKVLNLVSHPKVGHLDALSLFFVSLPFGLI